MHRDHPKSVSVDRRYFLVVVVFVSLMLLNPDIQLVWNQTLHQTLSIDLSSSFLGKILSPVFVCLLSASLKHVTTNQMCFGFMAGALKVQLITVAITQTQPLFSPSFKGSQLCPAVISSRRCFVLFYLLETDCAAEGGRISNRSPKTHPCWWKTPITEKNKSIGSIRLYREMLGMFILFSILTTTTTKLIISISLINNLFWFYSGKQMIRKVKSF